MTSRILACVLLLAAILAPAGALAADVGAGGPLAMIITYHTTPANRVAFREALEQSEMPQFERWKAQGVLQSARVLFNRHVDAMNWDAMALLTFAKYSDVERWKAIERERPAGLSPKALALTSAIDTVPGDFLRSGGKDSPHGVFLVIPYESEMSAREYAAYLDSYVLPQLDGWMKERVLARYGAFVARYPAGRPWQALLVFEYEDESALGARDATTAKVRAQLAGNAQWKAISDSKKNVRHEESPVVADPIFAAPQAAVSLSHAAPARIVLLVDEIKAIRNLPVVLAERLGYLSDAGAQVTVMNVRDDVATADMLSDGRVDAVMAYYHHNIVNRSQGRAFEAIVTLGLTPGAKVLVANHARDKYRTVADLKGARIIAGGDGSSKTTVANALVLAGGHALSDYTRIPNESRDKILATLKSGGADLVVAPTPDGDFYESQGVASVFADLTTVEGTRQALGGLLPTATVYMRADLARQHPEVAQQLADAFVRTLRYIHSHSPEQILALIPPKIVGKDRAAYLDMLKQELPMFAGDGRMPAEDAEREWKVLAEFNPKYKPVKVDETYTNEYVDAALRRYR